LAPVGEKLQGPAPSKAPSVSGQHRCPISGVVALRTATPLFETIVTNNRGFDKVELDLSHELKTARLSVGKGRVE